MKLQHIMISFLVLIILTACGGIPKEAKERAQALPELSKKTLRFVSDKETAYLALIKGPNADFIGPYAKREKWIDKFTQAKQTVKHADNIIERKIKPLLKRNEESEVNVLFANIGKVNRLLRDAKKDANYPLNRANFLLNAKKHSSEWFAKAKEEVLAIDKLIAVAKSKSEKAKSDAKKYGWPKTDKDFNQVFSTVQIIADKAHKAFDVMKAEMRLIPHSSADYAKLGDATTVITTLYKSMQKKQPAFLKKTEELYHSYSKTLEDMRIEYYVKIGRSSWNSFSDWDITREIILISQPVNEDVYQYFDNITIEPIATLGIGWGNNFVLQINQVFWNALRINPRQNWPGGHNEAEYWVADVFTKAFHKYSIIEDEKERETDWVPVSEDFYWAHEEHLGMTILTKPYGMYESEIIKDAIPKGMQYIAKPTMVNGKPVGENKYGKWETDSSGHSFFHYYGMYHFLFGGNTYDYNDYRGYYNRRGDYYGDRDRFGTYGSSTYRKGSRYSKSEYAKRNPGSVREARASKVNHLKSRNRTAGKMQSASIRGAGPSNRGRGASGRGGK